MSQVLYARVQPQRLVLEKNIFMRFIPFMGTKATVFNGAEPLEQIVNTSSTEGTMRNLVKMGHAVSEKIF